MNNAQEPVLHHFSTVLHVQAFANLDRYCQQEIISDLATQIGTNPKTRNIGLKTMVTNHFYVHNSAHLSAINRSLKNLNSEGLVRPRILLLLWNPKKWP